MIDYFSDGLDPRGAEYAAERRTARSARQTAEAMDDMLELAMAPNERARQGVAQRIHGRRMAEAGRRAWWRRLDLLASLALVASVGYCTVATDTPDSGAVRGVPAAGVSQVPDASRAPVRSVRALTPCQQLDVLLARAATHGPHYADTPDLVFPTKADYAGLPDADRCDP